MQLKIRHSRDNMAFLRTTAEVLYPLALKDTARNYFVCYSINNHQSYTAVWQLKEDGKPIIGVFLRKTGILQIIIEPGLNINPYKDDLESLLIKIPWHKAIVTASVKDLMLTMKMDACVDKGAQIAVCSPENYRSVIISEMQNFTVRTLSIDDLDAVIAVYLSVFKGFASYGYMVEKILSGRGRAIGGFMDGVLITVSQSDYENADTAIVVGVATRPEAQSKGYGRVCFEHLCNQLILNDNKTLYLQYDSPIAGALYKSLGFEIVEQIFHVEKNKEVNR